MAYSKPQAFLFDLNGTMIDDMSFHIKAWHHILNEKLDAQLSWEQVRAQMYGKNTELFRRVFGESHFTEAEMNELSIEKEKRYQQEYLPPRQTRPYPERHPARPLSLQFLAGRREPARCLAPYQLRLLRHIRARMGADARSRRPRKGRERGLGLGRFRRRAGGEAPHHVAAVARGQRRGGASRIRYRSAQLPGSSAR